MNILFRLTFILAVFCAALSAWGQTANLQYDANGNLISVTVTAPTPTPTPTPPPTPPPTPSGSVGYSNGSAFVVNFYVSWKNASSYTTATLPTNSNTITVQNMNTGATFVIANPLPQAAPREALSPP